MSSLLAAVHRPVSDCVLVRNADFLSSIEILMMDQMNALAMQNWEHLQVSLLLCGMWLFVELCAKLQLVLSNVNVLPKESGIPTFQE